MEFEFAPRPNIRMGFSEEDRERLSKASRRAVLAECEVARLQARLQTLQDLLFQKDILTAEEIQKISEIKTPDTENASLLDVPPAEEMDPGHLEPAAPPPPAHSKQPILLQRRKPSTAQILTGIVLGGIAAGAAAYLLSQVIRQRPG